MKKLIMVAAFACAAAFAQAATYNWNCFGTAYWGGSETYEDFNGFSIYAFDANVIAKNAVLDLLSAGDTSKLGDALGKGAISGYEFDFSGSGISDDGKTPPYVNSYLVMLTTTQADGNQYFASYDITPIKVTDAIIAGGATLTTGDGWILESLPGAGGEWQKVTTGPGPEPTPEPTSGLMLLLGMAGLALRRRRA